MKGSSASLRSSVSLPNKTSTTIARIKGKKKQNVDSQTDSDTEAEAERLSSDLALFLSNPALQRGLADGSLDLVSYSTTVESELENLEKDCVSIYRRNAATIAGLREEMDVCDGILAGLQEMLLGFRADLGGLSGDIRQLQEQSRTLGIQLRNRRDAELGLREFLERIVVPPELADRICSGKVDEQFIECVKELERKFHYVQISANQLEQEQKKLEKADNEQKQKEKGGLGEGIKEEDGDELNKLQQQQQISEPGGNDKLESSSYQSKNIFIDGDKEVPKSDPNKGELYQLVQTTSCGLPPADTPAGKEMIQHLSKLRLRAVARARTYFLQRITELHRPKTNVRMIQINALLKYAPLMDFLLESRPEVFVEIRDVYVESMGGTLHALFRTYAAQLAMLDNNVATRKDVIAVEDAALRDTFSNRVNMSRKGDAFFLGNRHEVLDGVLIPNEAVKGTQSSSHISSSTSLNAQNDHISNGNTQRQNSNIKNIHKNGNNMNYNNNRSNNNLSANSQSTKSFSPILAHVAISEGETYPYEIIFKSIILHLMNAATNEYIFTRQFFKEHGPKTFNNLFKRTLGFLLEQLENHLFDCHDCLSLLLMIKLVHGFRRIMQVRKVPSLQSFFDSLTSLLWPRLKTVMDKQIRSLRDGTPKRLGGVDLHAHYVARRYAEFTCSMLLILNKGRGGIAGNVQTLTRAAAASKNAKATSIGGTGHDTNGPTHSLSSPSLKSNTQKDGSNTKMVKPNHTSFHRGSAGDMLMNDLSLLFDETILLLERLSDAHNTNKKKIVFMINNLDQIISVFRERRVTVGKEITTFSDLLVRQRELFVEEELLQNFSKMIAFVHETEAHFVQLQIKAAGTGVSVDTRRLDINAQVVERLVSEFSSTWKAGIDQINADVLSYFSNFRNGMEILKQVLTQLLLYYTRFQDIIRKVWRSKPPSFCKDLVSTTVILAEIKKYALSI